MTSWLAIAVLRLICWSVFLAAIAWPTLAVLYQCVVRLEPPQGGFGLSGRQLGLLWRSVWLSSTATALCLLVSIPGAYVVGNVHRPSRRPLIVGAVLALLLTPPMVCAFGWERILPAGFDAHVRCIVLWALWLWPVPALIIGAGWSRSARAPFEAATLSASGTSAFVQVALPQLLGYAAVAAAAVFIICLRDYGVPHACGLLVYATELLAWARDSTSPIDTVWLSLPLITVLGLVLIVPAWMWRQMAPATASEGGGDESLRHRGSLPLLLLAAACFAGSWLIPLGALTIKLASLTAFRESLQTYGRDLVWSLALAAGGGLAVACAGAGWMAVGRLRTVLTVWAIVWGLLPGATVGESLVVAYNHHETAWVYDHWPVVALSHLARLSWIGIAAGYMVRAASQTLADQAATDGADLPRRLLHVSIPLGFPVLLAAAGIVLALALGETEASALVRVPSFSPIAHVLIEKFHRFEYGMLVSLSLWLVAGAVVPAALAAIGLHRRTQ